MICFLTENVFSAEPSIKEKRKTRVLRNVHISTSPRLKIGTSCRSPARWTPCPTARRRTSTTAGSTSPTQ